MGVSPSVTLAWRQSIDRNLSCGEQLPRSTSRWHTSRLFPAISLERERLENPRWTLEHIVNLSPTQCSRWGYTGCSVAGQRRSPTRGPRKPFHSPTATNHPTGDLISVWGGQEQGDVVNTTTGGINFPLHVGVPPLQCQNAGCCSKVCEDGAYFRGPRYSCRAYACLTHFSGVTRFA